MTQPYEPNHWDLLKVTSGEQTGYKVFGGWSGGYLSGDSWRANSGISRVEDKGEYFLFHGYSGSVYKCYKTRRGLRGYALAVFRKALEQEGLTQVSLEEVLAKC